MREGIIQIYTGDGKGKTTAAVGLALRSWGRGLKVIFFQLLKAPDSSGEQKALASLRPPVLVAPFGGEGFIIDRRPTPGEKAIIEKAWERIEKAILSKEYDLVVIDELSHALNLGMLDLERVIQCLDKKPTGVEVVLTGRAMPEPLLNMARLVTEMRSVKHPYQQGLTAREGIDF